MRSAAPSGHLVIVPGLRVVRCGRDSVQIGLDAGRRLRLPRTEPVQRALRGLATGLRVADRGADPEVDEVVDLLSAHGCLVDGSLLAGPRPAEVAALALADPALLSERLARRRSATIAVLGHLGSDPGPLLAGTGLRVGRLDQADVALVLQVGELDRPVLDDLVRAGVAHLVVRLLDGVGLVGPFVVPGETACLRCVDAHLTEQDPRHPELVARYAAASALPRADGAAEPIDSALATLALAWAVRDVTSHVDGLRPSTWSTTVRLHPSLAEVTSVCWLRHPGCGCVWTKGPGAGPSGDQTSVTMEE